MNTFAGFAWPNKKKPVAFVDVKEAEAQSGSSRANRSEAGLVANYIRKMMAADVALSSGEAIGIITPYAGQVR